MTEQNLADAKACADQICDWFEVDRKHFDLLENICQGLVSHTISHLASRGAIDYDAYDRYDRYGRRK